METERWRLTAGEPACTVRTGAVSAAEVVRASLERIASVNPRVNAAADVLEESALGATRELDRKRLAGEELGFLAGAALHGREDSGRGRIRHPAPSRRAR